MKGSTTSIKVLKIISIFFIIIQILAYIGSLRTEGYIIQDGFMKSIGFNLFGIIGIIMLIYVEKKKKGNLSSSKNNKKYCKYCRSEIDINAKVCPICRKTLSMTWAQWVIGIVFGWIILNLIYVLFSA